MRGIMQRLAGVCGLKISAVVIAKFRFRFFLMFNCLGRVESNRATYITVERGSSVGRMPDSQSREPGFETRCYRLEVWTFSFTSRRLSRLSCINEYLAIDSGGNVSE